MSTPRSQPPADVLTTFIGLTAQATPPDIIATHLAPFTEHEARAAICLDAALVIQLRAALDAKADRLNGEALALLTRAEAEPHGTRASLRQRARLLQAMAKAAGKQAQRVAVKREPREGARVEIRSAKLLKALTANTTPKLTLTEKIASAYRARGERAAPQPTQASSLDGAAARIAKMDANELRALVAAFGGSLSGLPADLQPPVRSRAVALGIAKPKRPDHAASPQAA
jgi:hypothetical protein